jgi:hypothetical protein
MLLVLQLGGKGIEGVDKNLDRQREMLGVIGKEPHGQQIVLKTIISDLAQS